LLGFLRFSGVDLEYRADLEHAPFPLSTVFFSARFAVSSSV